jgi:hypothetical protein
MQIFQTGSTLQIVLLPCGGWERPAYLGTQHVVLEKDENAVFMGTGTRNDALAHTMTELTLFSSLLYAILTYVSVPWPHWDAGDAASVVSEQGVCHLHDDLPPRCTD